MDSLEACERLLLNGTEWETCMNLLRYATDAKRRGGWDGLEPFQYGMTKQDAQTRFAEIGVDGAQIDDLD